MEQKMLAVAFDPPESTACRLFRRRTVNSVRDQLGVTEDRIQWRCRSS